MSIVSEQKFFSFKYLTILSVLPKNLLTYLILNILLIFF